jgi:hypothetical protein
MNAPMPSLAVANQAAAAARMVRAKLLIQIADSDNPTTAVDALHAAVGTEGKPILRISIRDILLAQPGWGEERTARTIRQILDNLQIPEPKSRKMTIGWLLDRRAGGRRFMAFADALRVKDLPWAGFPHTKRPTTIASSSRGNNS